MYRTPFSAVLHFGILSHFVLVEKYWPCTVDVPRICARAFHFARLKVEKTWPLHRPDPHRHSRLSLHSQQHHANRRSNPRPPIRPSPPSARLSISAISAIFCYFRPVCWTSTPDVLYVLVRLSKLPYIRSLYKSVAWPSVPKHPSKGTFDDHCLHVSPL